MAKARTQQATPVKSTGVPPVDPTKLAPAARAAFYQEQLNATKKELKSANAGLPDTPEGREIRALIEASCKVLATDISAVNASKTLKILTVQIMGGKFHKVGGFSFVKSRTAAESNDNDKSESEAA